MSSSPLNQLKRLIPDNFKLYARTRFIGGHFRLRVPDRIFLEETAIPWFRDEAGVKSVLDVGCDWYTRSYPSLFKAERYQSIDYDPDKAQFAKGRESDHHVGSLLELDQYCGEGEFDLIICNGVLGWGVNDSASIGIAAEQMARCLRPGGWLILGWNDVEPFRPPSLGAFDEFPFTRFNLPSIGVDTFVSDTKSLHTFRFYQREEVTENSG